MLKTNSISYSIGGKQILRNVSMEFTPGTFNMILGPNGSGKSTFLKVFSGELQPSPGEIFYNGVHINQISKQALAKYRAVMSQQPDLNFPLTVEEVVMMGRYPHFGINPTKKDILICEEVMAKLAIAPFKHRDYLTLSGGEKQRVHFARVLTQVWEKPADGNYRYLILDEPLGSLDIRYQQEFLQIAREFCDQSTVLVMIIHDLNLAIQYADKLFFMKEGELAAAGNPLDILSPALIETVFSVNTTFLQNPLNGLPIVLFSPAAS